MSFPCSLFRFSFNNFSLSVKHLYYRNISTSVFVRAKQKYLLKKTLRLDRKMMKPISDSNLLSPPDSIRGLKVLDKSLFNKQIQFPSIVLGDVVISKGMPHLKKYILKMENLKPVQTQHSESETHKKLGQIETFGSENRSKIIKYVLLNPVFVKEWSDISESDRQNLEKLGLSSKDFKITDFTVGYENWKADELLKYILPEDKTSVAGFSKIGHIIHLNLREHVMEYKNIIGQILLDKISGCRTVVNKLDKIDNTYRFFEMEKLCGDDDMLVEVKENHCTFKFDFSTVYWNPRLSTEHERITNLLKSGDILYDVFAGVGPFSIPAAKKKCYVFANDLNPESFNWLNQNAKINKIKDGYFKTFNKDGRDFIKNDLKADLLKRLKSPDTCNIYITMNLPALAPEFLPTFCGLFSESEMKDLEIKKYPIVYVYCFAKGENPVQIAHELVEKNLSYPLKDNLIDIFIVRKVSSNKEMMRVGFTLNREILVGSKKRGATEENVSTIKKCV